MQAFKRMRRTAKVLAKKHWLERHILIDFAGGEINIRYPYAICL